MGKREIEDAELQGFKEFLTEYPGSSWLNYCAYIQYNRQKWAEFVHGVFGV